MLENSGNFYEYYSCATGKGRNNFAIRDNLIQDGLKKVLKMIIKSYEGEKDTEYDVGIISSGSNNRHIVIDHNIILTDVEK